MLAPRASPSGVDRFGASAPGPTLYKEFGITKEAAVAAAQSVM